MKVGYPEQDLPNVKCYACNNSSRGGKREGAGRPPGTGTGRKVTTSSINLPPALWDKLDSLRGELTRSAWIAAKIKNTKP